MGKKILNLTHDKKDISPCTDSLDGSIPAITCPPELMLIGRLSDGSIVEVNNTFCSLSGYSRKELIGKKYLELDIWESPKEKKLCIQLFKTQGEFSNYEINMKLKNGKMAPFFLSAHKVQLEGHDCFVSTARELTQQNKIKEALKQSKKLYSEAQKIAHMGHWELDLGTGRLSWSGQIFKIFEVNKNEFKASYDIFLDLVHPDDRDKVDSVYKESVDKKKAYNTIHRLKMPDGRIKYVHEIGRTEYNSKGLPIRSIGTVQDISSLKKAEMEKEKALTQLRQSQKLESVGTLAGGIAHDFNNILFAILGYAELAIELVEKGSRLANHLSRIIEASSRAKSLIHQILTFCRKTNDEKKTVMVRTIIQEALDLIRASIPTTIKITKHLNTDSLILADPTQIQQVMINLCSNAAYAMQEEGGVLSIELEDAEFDNEDVQGFVNMRPGKYLKLSISDTGQGMDANTRDRIFDPFFTTKSSDKGTGLGLSVVHGIVKNHNAQIMVYSEPGAGTTFKVFFPVMDTGSVQKPLSDIPLPEGREKVLIIDDETLFSATFKEK